MTRSGRYSGEVQETFEDFSQRTPFARFGLDTHCREQGYD
jgi:hypothetical protein